MVHRRLLADEDHWIIDARRVTLLQTVLSAGTWLSVVAAVLTVWLLRDEIGAPWRWLLPSGIALALLAAGHTARRASETLAAATFLAGAALTVAPATLSLLAEGGLLIAPAPGVTQLFADTFTNQQLLAASLTALAVSAFGLLRLRMTGFAWTTATMATLSYLALLLQFNWLDLDAEFQALTCLPLVGFEAVALALERRGRVRWTRPFHLVALLALVVGLDVMAFQGSTLEMIGFAPAPGRYLDETRLQALSLTLNGMLFLGLMLLTERSLSLDLAVEPGARVGPMTFGGRLGEPEHPAGLLEGQPGEELELDQLRFGRIRPLEPLQGLVQGKQRLVVHAGRKFGPVEIVQAHPFAAAAVSSGLLSSGTIDQDPAHGLGCGGDEMAVIVPSRLAISTQAKPCLVNEGRRLQGLSRTFAGHASGGNTAQLFVDQRQKFVWFHGNGRDQRPGRQLTN